MFGKNKFLILIFLSFVLLTFSSWVKAEEDSRERIENFSSKINISAESVVSVEETILYFFPNEKHGIVRKIPIKYEVDRDSKKNQTLKVKFSLKSVNLKKDDGSIESVPFESKLVGNDQEIRIGDPKKQVKGFLTYVISYDLVRVINFSPEGNENQDEFYWNVTGNRSEVPTKKASAEINFPKDIDPASWKFTCFTGQLGSSDKDCSFEATSNRTVFFESLWEIPAFSGLTVISGLPKGILQQPQEDATALFWEKITTYFFLILPFLAFILLFINWFLRGRDPKGKGTIIPFYQSPDNLTPTEIGTLFDEKADLKDISASIIHFATQGFLKIKEIENKGIFGFFKGKSDYELVLLKRGDFKNAPEKTIFDLIFPPNIREWQGNMAPGTQYPSGFTSDRVKLSELQDKFPQKINEIKTAVYSDLVKKGYFPKSPGRIRNTYVGIGMTVAFLGFILLVNSFSFLVAGSTAVTGLLVAIFGIFMPCKTAKGVDTLEKILGLKEYLTVAEKDRINFHNAPAKKPEVFEKLLPYAMVLQVEKEWAKQFEEIYSRPPAWFEGATPGSHFNSLFLVHSLSSFSTVANSSMGIKVEGGGASSGLSGFSGGGFSGGGFGGGSTGSW